MTQFERVKQTLKDLDISYQMVDHPAVFTTDEADQYIVGIEGVRTKSMFMTNKKKTAFYLLIMDDAKGLNFHEFEELTGAKRVKMASPESLQEKLGLAPGMVSIFGLINNQERDVQVFFDRDIIEEDRMSFHPNVNTHTIFVATSDVFKFIHAMNFDYKVLALD